MRRVLRVLALAGVLALAAGCRGYREYVIENNRVGAQVLYERDDYRRFVQDNNRFGAQGFYYHSGLRRGLNKLNDDIGPKHAYYYE